MPPPRKVALTMRRGQLDVGRHETDGERARRDVLGDGGPADDRHVRHGLEDLPPDRPTGGVVGLVGWETATAREYSRAGECSAPSGRSAACGNR